MLHEENNTCVPSFAGAYLTAVLVLATRGRGTPVSQATARTAPHATAPHSSAALGATLAAAKEQQTAAAPTTPRPQHAAGWTAASEHVLGLLVMFRSCYVVGAIAQGTWGGSRY
jgi:hypothetical protein